MSDTRPLHFVAKPGYARIRKDRVVRLKYAVVDKEDGRTLAFRDDLYYLHGGYGGAFPKVEQALEGLEPGDRAEVDLAPEDGYGPHVPELVITQDEADFPPEARQVGTRVEGEAPDGHIVQFVVTGVKDGRITVDGNHPLAGRQLHFVFEVLEVREATSEELQAGYAFAPAGEQPSMR